MLLTPRRLGAASACITVLLTTCTCAPPTPDDAGHDAGRGWLDSGSRDAARPDATRDVGRDAPEGGPMDGGPNDPEWVALDGQPDGVLLYVARHPERVLHVDWDSCGSGCLRAACDGCSFFRGFVDDTATFARVQRAGPEQLAALVNVATGTPVAAWQQWDNDEPIGRLAFPAIGGGRVAISGKSYPAIGSDLISIWVAPVGEAATRLTPVYQLETSSLIVNLNLVSASHQAWTVSPTNALFLRDDLGGFASFPGPGRDGMIQSPVLVADRVFYELWADHIRVWTGTVEEAPSALIDATPGEVRNFHTDGRTIVWLQGYDYDWDARRFARLELWTSPFATTATELRPRLVRPFPELYQGALGGHWLASQSAGYEMDVYDLNDGSVRHWTPPMDGMVRDVPLYATDDEILVTTNVGIFRIDPNTLPIVDPGPP